MTFIEIVRINLIECINDSASASADVVLVIDRMNQQENTKLEDYRLSLIREHEPIHS